MKLPPGVSYDPLRHVMVVSAEAIANLPDGTLAGIQKFMEAPMAKLDAAIKAATTGADTAGIPERPPVLILEEAAEEITRAASTLTAKDTGSRGAWLTIGSALWRVRDLAMGNHQLGAWVKSNGFDKIPGLSTAPSRSDCIWLAERMPCSEKIPYEQANNPRAVRALWRLLFKETVAEYGKVTAANWPVPLSTIEGIVEKTGCTATEAQAALDALLQAHLAAGKGGGAHPVLTGGTPAFEALVKALKKAAKKAAVPKNQVAQAMQVAGYSGIDVTAMAAWSPKDGAPEILLTIMGKAVTAGVSNVVAYDLMKLTFGPPLMPIKKHVTYAEAGEAIKAAMKDANEKGYTVEEIKEFMIAEFLA